MNWVVGCLLRRHKRAEETLADVRTLDQAAAHTATAEDDRVGRLDLTRVVLSGGLGQIRFGMTEPQVEQLLGAARKREMDKSGGVVWSYADPLMDLQFMQTPSCGLCLVTITVTNSSLFLRGIPLVDRDEMETASALLALGIVCHGKQRHDRALHGLWSMEFSHGLTLRGWKGPTDTVSWTILPDNGKAADIDWSGRECVG